MDEWTSGQVVESSSSTLPHLGDSSTRRLVNMQTELIIFVGLQAAGKSTYYRANYAATHVHVSKDLMTSTRNRDARQAQMIEAALKAGKSVVVDNTNPTPVVRAPLIALGKRLGAGV